MKKIIAICILVLSIASPCLADSVQGKIGAVIRARSAAPACTPSTPGSDNSEIGNIAQESTALDLTTNDSLGCFLYAADCSGTPGIAYVYHAGTNSQSIKVGVFSTTDTNANSAPTNGTLIGSWVTVSASTAAWGNSGASKVGGTALTATTKYWVCEIVGTATDWNGMAANGVYRHAITSAGAYDTPPSSLPESGYTSTSNRKMSIFVGIE